jgi:hypothetical protein
VNGSPHISAGRFFRVISGAQFFGHHKKRGTTPKVFLKPQREASVPLREFFGTLKKSRVRAARAFDNAAPALVRVSITVAEHRVWSFPTRLHARDMIAIPKQRNEGV